MAQDDSDDARWSAWMAAAQAGDKARYGQLLEELGHAVAGYLRARFGALEFVEDCVQECLIAIHRARHTYDPARPFRPWLFAIVRNKAIDMLRSRSAYQGMLEKTAPPATAPDAEAELESRQLLGALAPKYQEALALTKIMGLSITEAAGRLGISESAMKVRVHRGLGAMRRLLESEGP